MHEHRDREGAGAAARHAEPSHRYQRGAMARRDGRKRKPLALLGERRNPTGLVERVEACWQRDLLKQGTAVAVRPMAVARMLQGRKGRVPDLALMAAQAADDCLATICIRTATQDLHVIKPFRSLGSGERQCDTLPCEADGSLALTRSRPDGFCDGVWRFRSGGRTR